MTPSLATWSNSTIIELCKPAVRQRKPQRKKKVAVLSFVLILKPCFLAIRVFIHKPIHPSCGVNC